MLLNVQWQIFNAFSGQVHILMNVDGEPCFVPDLLDRQTEPDF